MGDDKRLDESDPDVRKMRVNEIAKDFFVDELPPRAPEKPKRKSRAMDKDLKAMKRFAKALQEMDESSRRAAIAWITDRFLGVRIFR